MIFITESGDKIKDLKDLAKAIMRSIETKEEILLKVVDRRPTYNDLPEWSQLKGILTYNYSREDIWCMIAGLITAGYRIRALKFLVSVTNWNIPDAKEFLDAHKDAMEAHMRGSVGGTIGTIAADDLSLRRN